MRLRTLRLLLSLSVMVGCQLLAISQSSTAFAQNGYSVRSNADDHLYRINMQTGVATDLGLIGFGDAEGLAFDNLGRLFAIGGTESQLWNITSPPGLLVGNTGVRNGVDAGLGFDRTTGTMYNANGTGGSSSLYRINLASVPPRLSGPTACLWMD